MDALPLVRAGIEDADVAENTVRLLVENGLQQAVTAFQRFAEVLYEKKSGAVKARRNAFQNLDEGGGLWSAAYGKSYAHHLSTAELMTLQGYFQQRHLFAHKDGIVDADYISRSGDRVYRVGQRLTLRESGVRECIDLVEKLATGLRSDAGT